MNSVEHAAVGAVVAAGSALALGLVEAYSPAVVALLLAAGVAGSVLVDLDHFPIAWLVAGDLESLRRALRDPLRTLTDPAFVFADLEFPWLRLTSHVLLGTAVAAAAATVDARLAAYVGALLVAHVVADLLRDFEAA